jgi:hypothetical protein
MRSARTGELMFGPIPRITLSLAVTAGGIVAACHPVTPTPALPEVTHNGPNPPDIDPGKQVDAGVEVPDFGQGSLGHREATVRVADVPVDAGINDVIDLPPVPDADPDLMRDAGTPLGR